MLLAAVWLVAGLVFVTYLKQLEKYVDKKSLLPKPPPLPVTHDEKLLRAAEHAYRARSYLKMSAQLAKEAGVPTVAIIADDAATLADTAGKLAEASAFLPDDEPATIRNPTTAPPPSPHNVS